jgi:uncharacterized protein (DUF2267 family)
MDDERSELFATAVGRRAGPMSTEQLHTAIDATLAGLGGQLSAHQAALHSALGERWMEAIERGRKGSPESMQEVLMRIVEDTGLPQSRSVELVDSVLTEVAAHLSAHGLEELCRALPSPWASKLVPPSTPARSRSPGPVPTAVGGGRTLATGKPGSGHPLAESKPSQGHAHSIANDPDPHADTKIGSTHGVESDTTLAKGAPGSRHGVADSD